MTIDNNDTLTQRLNQLESQFSHQEVTIDILNQMIIQQQTDIALLKQQLQVFMERMTTHLPHASLHQEKPPHY